VKRYKRRRYRDSHDSDVLGVDSTLTPKQRLANAKLAARIESFAAVFTKVNSIVAGRTVPVKLSNPITWSFDGATPPGWTDGETIFLSKSHLQTVLSPNNASALVRSMSACKGLNYHELAHVLYTPRHTHKPLPDIRRLTKDHPSAWRCFNLLEDQRIERLFVARWPVSSDYFTLTVAQWVLDHAGAPVSSDPEYAKDHWALRHLLLHGRRYLPADMRQRARAKSVARFGEADTTMLEKIIDEYRSLSFPSDGDRAVELVRELAVWFERQAETHTHKRSEDMVPNVTHGHEHQRASSAESVKEQRRIQEQADADDEADGGSQSAPCPMGDKEEDAEAEKAEATTATAGDGSATPDTLEEQAAKAVDEALDATRTDILDTIQAARELEKIALTNAGSKKYASTYSKAPAAASKTAADRLTTAMAQLRYDAEPAWVKRVSSGRVNIEAMMQSRGVDLDVFDEWKDAGDDATSIEVVVLLDQSQSMGGDMVASSEAMWTIKKSCDRLDIPCTVVGYSNEMSVLYRAESPAGEQVAVFPVVGGTLPHAALEAAYRVFAVSDKRHKVMFAITDGDWFRRGSATRAVRDIRSLGVSTHLIYLASTDDRKWNAARHDDLARQSPPWNGCETGVVVGDVRGMVRHIEKELVGLAAESATV